MGAEKHPADDDKIQGEGRKDNAAQHLNAARDNAGAERYPPTKKDDSVEGPATEGRSFGGDSANPEPRQGAGDGGPDPSVNQGRVDAPDPDPVEGKR